MHTIRRTCEQSSPWYGVSGSELVVENAEKMLFCCSYNNTMGVTIKSIFFGDEIQIVALLHIMACTKAAAAVMATTWTRILPLILYFLTRKSSSCRGRRVRGLE